MNDTHPEAKLLQQKIYLNMSNSDRFRIACEMSDALFLFAESDIKNKFPEISPSLELTLLALQGAATHRPNLPPHPLQASRRPSINLTYHRRP